jgi:hypothetical protein
MSQAECGEPTSGLGPLTCSLRVIRWAACCVRYRDFRPIIDLRLSDITIYPDDIEREFVSTPARWWPQIVPVWPKSFAIRKEY